MCSILYTEPSTVQEHSPSGHITGHQQSAHFRKIHQSIFSAIRPILVRMLRTRKKPTVAMAIITSAIQKAMSQLCCLAIVLKGSPAIKAPTVTKESLFSHMNASMLEQYGKYRCFCWSYESAAYHQPSELQQHERFHKSLKEHFHWLSPQTRQLVRRKKIQTQHQGRGSRSVYDNEKMWNTVLES